MTTATLTSPRHAEIVDILKSASKGMTSREIFAKAKGFEDADEVSKALNYMAKKGQVEREKVAQNTYCYWLTSSKASDIGNTLLRGTNGSEEPMPDAPRISAVINDALKPRPEIDAVTQEMANQAEIAYQVLSEALGLTPEQMSDLTLADLANATAVRIKEIPPANAASPLEVSENKLMRYTISAAASEMQRVPVYFSNTVKPENTLAENISALIDALLNQQSLARMHEVSAAAMNYTIDKIRQVLDIGPASSGIDLLAEIENISRLADRTAPPAAQNERAGPYIIISDPRGAAGTHENINEARRLAERAARHSTLGRSAIVSVVAEVELVPQWSDA